MRLRFEDNFVNTVELIVAFAVAGAAVIGDTVNEVDSLGVFLAVEVGAPGVFVIEVAVEVDAVAVVIVVEAVVAKFGSSEVIVTKVVIVLDVVLLVIAAFNAVIAKTGIKGQLNGLERQEVVRSRMFVVRRSALGQEGIWGDSSQQSISTDALPIYSGNHPSLRVPPIRSEDVTNFHPGSTLLMATDPESRPLYFANGDFAKTVADIIASPRRGKAYASQDALYEISDRQRDYYTKCFRHLMKTTQGTTSLEGVLNGGDSRVVDFFRRSGLDNDSLSRIWSLSDVNEDGWLDINEFSTAMHLIVLRVKTHSSHLNLKAFVLSTQKIILVSICLQGHVAIPTCLPACIRPPYTPPHIAPQMQYSPAASAAVPRGPPSTGSWNQFDDDGPLRNSVAADKKDAHLAEFSDVPPLLVDSRPTAVKQTIPLLALKSPCGPPPQPPPRPQQRGHTRSASLDMMKNIQLAQTGMSLLYGDRRPSDSTAVTHDHTPSLTISGSIPTAPPPPVPQRVSPPAPIPRRSSAAETQTEGRYVDVKEIERYIAEFDTQIADLLGDEVDAALGKGVERWARRCEGLNLSAYFGFRLAKEGGTLWYTVRVYSTVSNISHAGLRAQNAELEAERARMAQVRIQLELRLQELEEGSCKGHKPTSL
ncbi:unnamed protein product [Haemonchus placei]|uniref:EF-hand domain-containing protein n=1 Tax=Haemonchus placei TaxID=6290 RepID=A0A158QLQ7_HAEPC|nr:unnamed protein product [Haemonchus placei]